MMQQMMQQFAAFFQQQVMQQCMNLEDRMRKTRQCVIEKLDRFDGRDISKSYRAYEEAMEDNRIDDSVAIEIFYLIVKPELRGPIEELRGQHSVSWRNFKVALKAEYFLEYSQRKFDQLPTSEQQSLRSEKVELFVQAADSCLQKSLVQLLEDPAGELGLTNDWDAVPAAINLLVKRQKRIDKSIVVESHEDFEENGIVEKIVEKPKASSSPMMEGKEKPKAAQSSTLDDSTMDDLIKDHSSYSLILGQPYIIALRMETKVLDDGSAYARVRSKDGFSRSTIIKGGYDGAEEGEFSQGAFSSSFVGLTSEGSYSYRKFGELYKWKKQYVSHFQSEMQGCAVLNPNDVIFGIFEEVSYIDTIVADLKAIDVSSSNNDFIKVNSFDMYEVLSQFCEKCEDALEVQVETKYKKVTKKVRPQAVPLQKGSDNVMEKASQQPTLRDSKKIGHKFTKETLDSLKIGSDALLTEVEIQCFKEMISTHGKAFSTWSRTSQVLMKTKMQMCPIGTYRRKCKFGGGECRDVKRPHSEKSKFSKKYVNGER
ncbi:hypothetical protein L7F22_067001 [Adiantum nelumboides]|nr:hypothetical protein [Adiantum nelumboides]